MSQGGSRCWALAQKLGGGRKLDAGAVSYRGGFTKVSFCKRHSGPVGGIAVLCFALGGRPPGQVRLLKRVNAS